MSPQGIGVLISSGQVPAAAAGLQDDLPAGHCHLDSQGSPVSLHLSFKGQASPTEPAHHLIRWRLTCGLCNLSGQWLQVLKNDGRAWTSKYARGGSARKNSARSLYIVVDALQGHITSNGWALEVANHNGRAGAGVCIETLASNSS